MDNDDAISIYSGDGNREGALDRREILAPAIHSVIGALGGYEGDNYKLGDECYGCLKDLKKFWRKDDTDDERTVARIFWEARVLPNDLVPILLETAGKGLVDDKCAIACADIVTAMTWPIDMAEELKELDEELDKGTDYTQLLQSHLHYKAALLRPDVIQALLGIMLPCIAKERKERKERDSQIANVVLHLFRNLAFIKDRPPNIHASSDQADLSSLQSKLIKTYSETHVLDLLLTIASNATDTFFNQWNTLVLETLYFLFRSVLPSTLAEDQAKRPQGALTKLLEAENRIKLENARKASSRHSRFGTTISVSLNSAKGRSQKGEKSVEADGSTPGPSSNNGAQSYVLHRQQAINKDAGSILDMKKRKTYKKTNKVDELGLEDNLSHDAKSMLQNLGKTFIETCFNTLLASLLKDIKSERPKITEKDHLRLLFVAKWFLEFFLAIRSQQKETAERKDASNVSIWGFDLVGEVLERGWIVWILKRMREAVDEKPKLWTELQAGIECLTQLLLLIDNMASSEIADPELNEAAELLQQQIVYNGEVLDISVESLRSYKEGVQSLRYLDSSIRLAYSLLRMLEKWAKARGNGELYVRKKVVKRGKRGKNPVEDDEMPEEQIQMNASDSEHIVQEIMFTFETFELKFAHEEITQTLLTYLGRYHEFNSSEQMKRVVNLLHRQAVKVKAEGLFFKVSTLNLFKSILARQTSLPRDQPYKDLVALINFIVRKFFKAVSEDSMLIVEAFFPKNRGRWKQYSSWEPEEKERKRGKEMQDSKYPQDVQVKKGHSWSEQLGIAIACLLENGQDELVDWAKEILTLVIGQKQRLIEETDGSSSQSQADDMDDDGTVREASSKLRQPSNEVLAKFEDYLIPYISDEQADAATKNPYLKLVFRLIKFYILDDNADELEWYVPAAILPSDLQSSLNVINQFLETPLDLGGKKASQMLSKKVRRRHRRAASDDEDDAKQGYSDDDQPKQKKAKKKKEKEVYKSAQFIEDSDAEYGNDETFWAKEKELREKTERLAVEGKASNMKSTGTKKRRTKESREGSKKRQKGSVSEYSESEANSPANVDSDSDAEATAEAPAVGPSVRTVTPLASPAHRKRSGKPKTKVKPRPKPRYQGRKSAISSDHSDGTSPGLPMPQQGRAREAGTHADSKSESEGGDAVTDTQTLSRKTKARIVYSDEDE